MKHSTHYNVALFSYGTLQDERVQQATFKRKLDGHPDTLSGYVMSSLVIHDPNVLDKSGENVHPIVHYTGKQVDQVQGHRFLISAEELAQADEYEVDDYERVNVTLQSGEQACAYVGKTRMDAP